MPIQKYVRLLSYEDACKMINFVNHNYKEDYACVVVGGVSLQIAEDNWAEVEGFIKNLGVPYELTDKPPYKVVQELIDKLNL